MKRMNIGCSLCSWNEAACDIHHIIHKVNGGTNDHSNLTYICPNCHRKAHSGLVETFVTLQEQLGDRWQAFYFPDLAGMRRRGVRRGSVRSIRLAEKRAIKIKKIQDKKQELLSSNIDFSKFGWVVKAATVIGITPQKVSRWVSKNVPELKVYKRNGNDEGYGKPR